MKENEAEIFMLGAIHRTITVGIRQMQEMRKSEDEILTAIRPYLNVQQEIIKNNHLAEEQIGIHILKDELDYRKFLKWLKEQEAFTEAAPKKKPLLQKKVKKIILTGSTDLPGLFTLRQLGL